MYSHFNIFSTMHLGSVGRPDPTYTCLVGLLLEEVLLDNVGPYGGPTLIWLGQGINWQQIGRLCESAYGPRADCSLRTWG